MATANHQPQREPAGEAAWSALMRAAQDGDAASYRRLLIEILPFLRRHVAHALHQSAGVEDAVQDILLTLHAVRATYDPSRPFKPWLAAIARHRLIDHMRRHGRQTARERPLAPEHEELALVESNQEAFAIDAEALRAALASLPPGQRQALEMTKLREMSLKEASSATGLSVGALKVATHRGLLSLRKLLNPARKP